MTTTNLISDDVLSQKLEASPAPRVTKLLIDSRIKDVFYIRILETVTVCNITLDNGYTVRGESACVNIANYDQAIGERISYDNAYQKLWPLFGFLLAENQYQAKEVA